MQTKLIYQDGTSNKFWYIIVLDNTHTVTFGRIGTGGISKTKLFDSPEDAIKDANKLIASKKKKGYQEIIEEAVVIRDDYTFAGKAIKDFKSSIYPETAVKVKSEYDENLKVVDKLDLLAKLPNIAEMDTLVIGAWQEAHDPVLNPILEKLIELKDTFSGLKHLFIGDMDSEDCELSWIVQTDYSFFYPHFPSLETFGVKGGTSLKLGMINLPNLKNLVVETGGLDKEVVQDIIHSDLENLEYLELWLGTDEYGCNIDIEDLKPILDGKYPLLRYLGLKNYYQTNDLAKALLEASVLDNVKTLDLSMGTLTNKGAAALYENEALLNLKHLNCRHHYLSNEWIEKLKAKFDTQKINLNDQEEADDYDDEVYYYVEIGE